MMGFWLHTDQQTGGSPDSAREGKRAEKSASRTGILGGESRRPPIGSLRSPTFFAVSPRFLPFSPLYEAWSEANRGKLLNSL